MAIEPAALLAPGFRVDPEHLARLRAEQTALREGGLGRITSEELFEIGSRFHETLFGSSNNEAKSAGRDGVRHFTDELEERAQRRLRLDLLLRNAISRDEFHLVYQPQVAADDGRLLAVEALLRWRTPELGDIPPGQFIPVAEVSSPLTSERSIFTFAVGSRLR